MQKKYIIGIVAFLIAVIVAGVVYYLFIYEEKKPPRPKRDPNAWLVPPVAYPMQGKTFVLPEYPEVAVTLDAIYPSTKRDYPMGRFTLASSTGTLTALDDFATDLENSKRAVPIVVEQNNSKLYYLALLEESQDVFNHTSSVYLGESIRITKVTRDANNVTVAYSVHANGQPLTELPSITTSAIIDITNGVFVQEGRKPWIEATQIAKEFKGRYLWQKTTGETEVLPTTVGVFSMIFDGPRISLTTDCNDGSSEMTPPLGTSTKISFGAVSATKKFCTSSEEGPYFTMIESITDYAEQADGIGLTFTLADGSLMYFVKEGEILEFESGTTDPVSNPEDIQ